MINLEDPIERKKLVSQIEDDVEAYCKQHFKEDPRTHLGASQVGGECLAEIWFNFRWVKLEEKAGHMLRLLNRGHREEERFVQWLEGIGFELHEIDPATGKQYRINGVKGHFGGSLDSIAKPPERYGLGDMVWLGEFKTHNEESYTKLAGKKPFWSIFKLGGKQSRRTGGKGVKLAKPQHFAQMSSYGRAYGYKYGLYCAVNKNTDELYYEIVPLDWRLADDGFRKAEIIINSQTIPPRIALTDTFQYCKNLCSFVEICHHGELPTKNCRSCINARPIEDAQWWCDLHSPEANAPIPKEVIPVGCDSWKAIING